MTIKNWRAKTVICPVRAANAETVTKSNQKCQEFVWVIVGRKCEKKPKKSETKNEQKQSYLDERWEFV